MIIICQKLIQRLRVYFRKCYRKTKRNAPNYVLKKLLDYATGISIAAISAVLYSYMFPPPVYVQMRQSGLGEHCPNDLFNAIEAHISLTIAFAPPATRYMAICKAASYDRSNLKNSLKDYLIRIQSDCFTLNELRDKWIVGPNMSSGKVKEYQPNGKTFYACNCDPRQVPLILERGFVCGMKID